jgi:hypothetical protein
LEPVVLAFGLAPPLCLMWRALVAGSAVQKRHDDRTGHADGRLVDGAGAMKGLAGRDGRGSEARALMPGTARPREPTLHLQEKSHFCASFVTHS